MGRGWLFRLMAAVVLALPLAGGAAPTAVDGTLDLSAWDFERDGIVFVDGAWEFAPGRLLAPGEPWPADALRVAVPGEWNTYLGSRYGTGTYRVRVSCTTREP